MIPRPLLALALACPALSATARSQELVLDRVLAVESLGARSRSAVLTDALLARHVRGELAAPAAGDTILSATGEERTWEVLEAGDDGWLRGRALRGGWAHGTLEVPSAGSWRLSLNGPSMALVDGEPRYGDVYQLGITAVPLHLEAGPLELWLRGGRGAARVALEPAPAPVYFEALDPTLPDVVREEVGGTALLNLAVIVSNATPGWVRGWRVRTSAPGQPPTDGRLPDLGPESLRKVGLRVAVFARPEGETLPVTLELFDPEGTLVHSHRVELAVRGLHERHRRTFVSKIDRSVQYYAVTPPPAPAEEPAGLVLSLHGASVEASSQAAAYAPKEDLFVVAPTNRRPYGFDWEDQGRRDAIEVLEHARRHYGTDPARTYLTGHSMGGHGTWQLGVHFPGRFAVVAPSAGWRDFWSYGGAAEWPEEDPLARLLLRSTNASRTLWLEQNLLHAGVYVLHGDADDNVPVGQARTMRERLAAFHPDFAYFEQPGAGHWWGNPCVDWPPLFDFIEHHRLPSPEDVLEVEFRTISPTINDRCHWLRVLAQERWRETSRARARIAPAERRVEIDTENVTVLALDLRPFVAAERDGGPLLASGEPLTLVEGESTLEVPWPEGGLLHLARHPGASFAPAPPRDPWYKGAHRAGPFKEAFDGEMVLVFGTAGTPEEQAWSYARARLDHETWRYRGNGQVDLVPDTEFVTWPVRERNVILYGNQDTNLAFPAVLGDQGAFHLGRGRLSIGDVYTAEGDDLALLACYPRRDTDTALVAVVGGTGLPGLRLTEALPYFVSGVGYPDWTVLGTEFLDQGLAGVRATGWFRDDWSPLEGAEWAAR